jgi:hypothetical protein
LDYVSFAHISRRLTELKRSECEKKIKEMGKKSKDSYQYDLVKRGGKSEVMRSQKLLSARFYQLKRRHALSGKYLQQIGKEVI